jgi:hypothetical protein
MVQMIDKKTLKRVGSGVSEGAGSAWKQARKQAGRIEFRAPWVYHRPMGGKPWLLGILIFSSVAALIGGLLYLRKRKQVSDRYTMGEPDASTQEAVGSLNNEAMTSATP